MTAPTLYASMLDAIANILARYGEDDARHVAERYAHATGFDPDKLMAEARALQFTPRETAV